MPRHIKLGDEFEDLGGGVANTGDATAADVASGKTFSSAVLTNVAGSSTKNATVAGSAPILPVQAFVDHIQKFIVVEGEYSLDISYQGVTYIAAGFQSPLANYLRTLVDRFNGPAADFLFHGNAIPAANINAILACFVENGLSLDNVLDLSGGTNAAPTGQGLTDKATLISGGWTVMTN